MRHFFLLSSLVFTLFSCSEDKIEIQDNQEILTSGTWIKTAVTFDKVVSVDVSGPDIEKAYIDDVESCLLDEVFSFESGFDLIIDNPVICESNEQAIFNCNWSKMNSTMYAMEDNCGGWEAAYTVIRIANDSTAYLTMEKEFNQFPFDPVTLKYEWTLKKE